ncbi:MAG TPA: DUF4232 domain-containing protein [Micromonosporaceae bacterium]|jgi:hypothetical protein
MKTGVLVASLVLVLVGCSSPHHDSTGGVRLIPWDGTVPAQLRPATDAPAPPCQASRLKVVGSGFQFTPAISGGTGTVTLRNAGPAACRLTGRPDVRIIGGIPAPRQEQTPLPAQPPAFPTVVPPDSTLLAMLPGAAATLDVDWRNWCVPRSSKTPVPPHAIRLTLPGGAGSVDVGYNAVPPCEAPSAATTVGVRPFQPAPLPATPPWTSSVVRATIQPLSGGKGQLTGKRGETVRFVVQVHNPSATPIPFERCPLLVEMLAPAGRPEAYQLNCRAAAQLPAGGSLRFEMHIRIPADAPTGNNGLFWELDPTGARGPEVVSRIVVAAR